MPKLADINKFCEDLPEIKTSHTISRKKFHPHGLFSEQIFGPVKSFTCKCKITNRSGKRCPTCGIEYVSSKERRRRFAKIILPVPVINPLFYDLLHEKFTSEFIKKLDFFMKEKYACLYVPYSSNEDVFITEKNEDEKYPSDRFRRYTRHEAIKEFVKWGAATLNDAYGKYILANIDKLILTEIPVIPPDLRPAMPASAHSDRVKGDIINDNYSNILTKKEAMEKTTLEILRNNDLYFTYSRLIQNEVNIIYKYITSKMSKKEGLIRGNILGKRMDFSGRAVIVPDPTLSIDQCYLPYYMLLELFKIQIAHQLIEAGKFKIFNNALDYISECIELNDYALYDIVEKVTKNEVCLLNRQPSLHRLGLLGFEIKVCKGFTIGIYPLICAGYNADFDGDQMAVYLPISEEAKQEVREKFFASKNLYSPTNASLTTIPSQDIVLGIYLLTNNMIPELAENVECKGHMISGGRAIFNNILPKDFGIVDDVIRKKLLYSILAEVAQKYDSHVVTEILDNIKNVGFYYATYFGVTLSLDNFKIEGIDKFTSDIYDMETSKEQLSAITSKETEAYLKNHFKYSYLIDSGARGTWDQARQIVMTRGYISNFNGQIQETPIKSSLVTGLSPEEFFTSTYGSRKGLLDTAINTGVSGYLFRKLIFAACNMEKSLDLDDCGTTEYLDIKIDTEKIAKMLEYRWYLDEVDNIEKMVTSENYKNLIGKTLKFRSPVYCKSDQICHKCYGGLYKLLHSRYIGIIAAQGIGEIGTQLVLRSFHTSGVASTKIETIDLMKQEDIVGDLTTVNKLLHGKSKDLEGVAPSELARQLFKIYNQTSEIHHVHMEVIVAQKMWAGRYKWRLHPKRDNIPYTWHSIQTIPSMEGWLLGFGFGNPKKNLLLGMLTKSMYSGILDKILLGKKL